MGMLYVTDKPDDGISPKPCSLPDIETESQGQVDWSSLQANFSCVLGTLRQARKRQGIAFFDEEHFRCLGLGGAFYLGFVKPQLNAITYLVSTGIPNQIEGKRWNKSFLTTRTWEAIRKRIAWSRIAWGEV
jgi:hypothetical protein